MNREIILKAYALISDLTPLKSDCGSLCGKACCMPDDDGKGGVYLFPGEYEMLKDCAWGHIESDGFGPMLVCGGACERGRRPLACRVFPLTPFFNGEKWNVRLDARSKALCPLARSGVKGLDSEFARSVRSAVRLIADDAEGLAFLEKWQALEEEFRSFKLI